MAKKSARVSAFDRRLRKFALGFLVVIFGFGFVVDFVTNEPAIAIAIVTFLIAAFLLYIWLRLRAKRKATAFRLQKAENLGSMLTGSGADFEDTIAALLSSAGFYSIERIGGSGDLGVDVKCVDPDNKKVIVQCKRYGQGQKIGSPAIQMLIGAVVNNHADRGIFVTTSTYTQPAITAAHKSRIPIELWDGDAITTLARQTR